MITRPTLLRGYDGLLSAVGADLGASSWLRIEQCRVDAFADTTGDHAWIHVDPARASAGPFGRCIAHGALTLSLITMLAAETFRVQGLDSALHYGYDRVRFITPVGVGSHIRARVSLVAVQGGPNGCRASYRILVDTDDGDDPACLAELIYFYVFAASAPATAKPPPDSVPEVPSVDGHAR